MLFDLIIINFNTPELTIECVNSARNSCRSQKFNVIIVDNNSSDNSVELFKNNFSDITIVETGKNLGYSGALNEGVKYAKSDVFILSNSDIVFLDDSIIKMIMPIINGQADITGPQLLYPNNLWQESYNRFPGYKLGVTDLFLINTIKRNYLRKFYKVNLEKQKMKKVDFVDGAIMTVSRNIFEKVGGFDTEFSYFSEETTFSYQATKLGARIYHIPDSILIHYRGASYGIKKIPIDYIEKMIYSKVKFCKKFLSNNETRFYIKCEKYHFLTLHKLSNFFKHKDTKYGDNYYEIYKIWDKVLNEI